MHPLITITIARKGHRDIWNESRTNSWCM